MFRIPPRGRTVTDEPLTVAPFLMGAPLASFRRRLAAFALDLVVFGLVVGGVFCGLSLLSIHREDPTLLPRLATAADGGFAAAAADTNLVMDLVGLVARRSPGALPEDLEEAALAGNRLELVEQWGSQDLVIGLGSGKTTMTRNGDKWLLSLGTDVWLGSWSSLFSWGAIFVGWFTLWSRSTRGRSPGKWVVGVRVERLDGRSLGWWGAFSRAGGYSASTATLLLGFLEMIWDPNRQTLHDRIANTVVLRGRRSPRKTPAPAPSGPRGPVPVDTTDQLPGRP